MKELTQQNKDDIYFLLEMVGFDYSSMRLRYDRRTVRGSTERTYLRLYLDGILHKDSAAHHHVVEYSISSYFVDHFKRVAAMAKL